MRELVWRTIKLLQFFVAACAGLWAMLMALSAIPEAGRNPASTDFAWVRNDWFVAFVFANILNLFAIWIASRIGKVLFASFLLLIWGASIVPAYQYYLYQLR
jgi:hypothetical protein